MFKVIKKSGKMVCAYRLGEDSDVLTQLQREGKIVPRGNGIYEVFSEEAVRGQSGKGEIARDGDYIKLSTTGFPYPNTKEFFEKNHRHIEHNDYEQIPKPLYAWDLHQPMCEEVEFLVAEKGLKIDHANSEKCFSAFLWGTEESAPSDAVIVFYSVTRNADGRIADADFNFVIRGEFEKFYNICPN